MKGMKTFLVGLKTFLVGLKQKEHSQDQISYAHVVCTTCWA